MGYASTKEGRGSGSSSTQDKGSTMNLKGLITMTEFYELNEEIANLIDAKLKTSIEDLSNINDLIVKEIEVAYRAQQMESVEINGGSK